MTYSITQLALPHLDFKTCPNCGIGFKPKSKQKNHQKYCSNFCRQEAIMKKLKAERRKSLNNPVTCPTCGKTFILPFVRTNRQKYCSKKCRERHYTITSAEREKEARIKRKTEFVTRLGGKCQFCGWNEWLSALDFHHVEGLNKRQQKRDRTELPNYKEFDVSKCVLLCANCHRRVHVELRNDKETE